MPLKNIKERKRELRAYYKKLRAECPQDIKQDLDKELTQKFLLLDEYKNCDTLFAFVSMPIECDTSKIIDNALLDNKRVALPKCKNKSGIMDFYFINSKDDLKKGMYSIFEPDSDKCKLVTDFSHGLCLVPGLCFDFQGYRLGFGKGYYDKFLNDFGGTSVGICYSRYVEKSLPHGIFDKYTDILVTEKFVNHNHND
ncbi:5-formyltetrahydrofolate cyclo-ligase [Ruminococcus sp. YE282]|jgi:5-formyltetrahydrofolate cyclo-ligase|uniref:5-formyltetrahydrofolate cyclo-ligase n=1 Tax=Ruminococcus sp. YE282 TaxID=3158780 RepID=UPI000888B6D3|nr:5-formyltetrahydrofolate cyclo-ligase [Ruminococcus bromii]MEE3498612.1 5-formyltetrahydrofolate cyclo-ligase [Ruminococcus bromii]SCX91199.1 5-formyltetrahydrofolate cyclo-ligase [Ruminococcus bromii]HCB94957.1 5-formyltetrahydrofolate cyclo-ligase [Ruminococcus sp.]